MRTFGACAAERCACDNTPRGRSARLRHRIRENSQEKLPARQPLQPQIIYLFIRLRSHTIPSEISIPADKELPLEWSSGILIGRAPPRNRPSFLSHFRRVPSPAGPAHAGDRIRAAVFDVSPTRALKRKRRLCASRIANSPSEARARSPPTLDDARASAHRPAAPPLRPPRTRSEHPIGIVDGPNAASHRRNPRARPRLRQFSEFVARPIRPPPVPPPSP